MRASRLARRVLTSFHARIGLNRGVASEVTALGAATLASQMLAAVAVLVLTRLYSPQAFGVYAAAIAVTAIVVVAGCLRYEQAIPIAESPLQAAELIVLSLALGVAILLLAAGVLLTFEPLVARLAGLASVGPYVGLILLAATGALVSSVLGAWAIRTRAFSELARTRLSQAVGLVLTQALFGLAGAGAGGLLLGDALGRGAGTTRLARRLWRDEGAVLREVRASSLLDVANRYRRFPIFSGPSALLDVVNQQLPTLTLVAMFGSTVGGLFLLANRVGSLPNGLTMAAVAPVFVAQSARVSTDPEALMRLLERTMRRLLVIGVGPATVLVVAGPWLFPLAFGQAWAEAGVIAALFAPMFLAQLVTAPLSGVLSVIERQDLHLAKELSNFLLVVLVVFLASSGRWTLVPTTAALSAVGTLGAIGYFAAMRFAVSRVRVGQ